MTRGRGPPRELSGLSENYNLDEAPIDFFSLLIRPLFKQLAFHKHYRTLLRALQRQEMVSRAVRA
jgi:hypothetical protein